jgi:hypothetical protein
MTNSGAIEIMQYDLHTVKTIMLYALSTGTTTYLSWRWHLFYKKGVFEARCCVQLPHCELSIYMYNNNKMEFVAVELNIVDHTFTHKMISITIVQSRKKKGGS